MGETNIFDNLNKLTQFSLSEKMINVAFFFSLLVGLVLLTMLIVSAVLGKKTKGLLITAGVITFIGLILIKIYMNTVNNVSEIIDLYVNNESELMDGLMGFYFSIYLKSYKINVIGAFLSVGWLLTLIAIAKNIKSKNKAVKILMIFALIIQVVYYLFYVPVPVYLFIVANLVGIKREIVQVIYDIIRYTLLLLPPLFILISSILTKVKTQEKCSC